MSWHHDARGQEKQGWISALYLHVNSKLPLSIYFDSKTHLKEIKNLLCNILLLEICTLLLHLIRMDTQCCFSIHFFNSSSSDQITKGYRLPSTFWPKYLLRKKAYIRKGNLYVTYSHPLKLSRSIETDPWTQPTKLWLFCLKAIVNLT